MQATGTLEECMGKLYELYMENRIDQRTTEFYLLRLKHEDGTAVFGTEEITELIGILNRDKREIMRRIEFELEELEGEVA